MYTSCTKPTQSRLYGLWSLFGETYTRGRTYRAGRRGPAGGSGLGRAAMVGGGVGTDYEVGEESGGEEEKNRGNW